MAAAKRLLQVALGSVLGVVCLVVIGFSWFAVYRHLSPSMAPAAPRPSGPARLVVNGDFEIGEPGKAPSNWWMEGNGYEARIERENPGEGKQCVHISCVLQGPEPGMGLLTQSFGMLKPQRAVWGSRVRFSAMLRGRASGNDWFGLAVQVMVVENRRQSIQYHDMSLDPLRYVPEWERFELTFDVPRRQGSVTPAVQIVGAAEVWVDDVRLEVLGPASDTEL